jgi:hypothetical protein
VIFRAVQHVVAGGDILAEIASFLGICIWFQTSLNRSIAGCVWVLLNKKPPSPYTVDFFVGVPRSPALRGHDRCFHPAGQLTELGCICFAPKTAARAVSLASKLPRAARFFIVLFPHSLPYVPLTILTIVWLEISCFSPPQAMGHIFGSLTLPNLEQLDLVQGFDPLLKAEWPHWPHEQFLALCERSAFPQSLSVLRLTNLRIPERELTQIPSALPALEHLQLIDKQLKDGPPALYGIPHHRQRSPRSHLPGEQFDSAAAPFRLRLTAAVHMQCLC